MSMKSREAACRAMRVSRTAASRGGSTTATRHRLFCLPALLSLIVGMLVASVAFGQTIPPGTDCFATTAGSTSVTFGSPSLPPIPADFFFPGSQPFTGTVELRGEPLTGYSNGVNTVVQRKTAAVMPGPATVQVELIQLHLVSRNPITVLDSGGGIHLYDMDVALNPGTPSVGTMSIWQTSPPPGGGGYFSLFGTQGITIYPRFVFTPHEGGLSVGPWDPPIGELLQTTSNALWQYATPPYACLTNQLFYAVPGTGIPFLLGYGGSTGEHGVIPPRLVSGCCLPPTWQCVNMTNQDCLYYGGMPQTQLCTGVIQSCCLPGGACLMIDALCCDDLGGTPGFSPTCLGDLNGNNIDDACEIIQPTGACCVGWTCTIQDAPTCAQMHGRYQGDGTTCNPNPCIVNDVVVCEPQPPNHPNTYWYDVTPGAFGRCDFHVRVYDPNPANYTNPVMPANWVFLVHKLLNGEWWASWWDPTTDCQNAFFGLTRFGFTNSNPSTWGDWATTIGNNNDPYDWQIDTASHHTALPDGSGYRVHVPTFPEAWYWKDYNGALADGFLPDYDQRQDFNADGLVDAGYCGPTAVANSIWWFHRKFPLAGVVPAGWTAINLVQDLAQRMATNNQTPSPNGHVGPYAGTYADDMKSGIDAYLQAQGVSNLLYEHTELTPTFDYINAEVQRSQDVTLLVGFWHIEQVQLVGQGVWMVWWKRVGGHFLTVAGVDPLNNRVAFSDPDGDFAEHGFSGVVRPAGTDHNHDGDNDPATTIGFRNAAYNHAVHNNETYASHDYYTLKPSFSPGGQLALVLDGDPLGYGAEMQAYHLQENGGEITPTVPTEVYESFLNQQGYPPPVVCQYYAEVEAAIVVSPFEACGPVVGGTGCKDVVCPVETETCLPKKIRHNLPDAFFPPAGTDVLTPTGGYIQVASPSGGTITYIIDGLPNNTIVTRGDPYWESGHRRIDSTITTLELHASDGGGGGGGGALIYLNPLYPSVGRAVGAPSTTTDYPADSFFDVYIKIDLEVIPGAQGLWHSEPIPLSALGIHAVPPLGSSFATPTLWSGVELRDQGGNYTGYRIVNVVHNLPPPQPPEWEVIECECIDPINCHIDRDGGDPFCVGVCLDGQVCQEIVTSDPNGDVIYECQCAPITCATCPGDVNGDNQRNGLDIQYFVDCVIAGGISLPCACADMVLPVGVGMEDVNPFVSVLINNTGPCPP
jgi:hypothetical protein